MEHHSTVMKNAMEHSCTNKNEKDKMSLYYNENSFELTDVLRESWKLSGGPEPHLGNCWLIGFSDGLDVGI